ncbi:Putative Zn(II)2Cys6 transcription factor (Eurofung) [Glarea lozoyensis ATCC 20868]|uniref:TPA: Putative Zn(II)2Cys6 transcription factor (Eurofung) n=1 Tax=Glarea lozoyensis (strain ATCC 20868 / MF5171) TaxID=1116229 RepID=S3D8X9_GLAL2|nr:Putative Zn(II)2Cys6 transcription factor (Eurofung) [Glarea lozoyensis ATCC 20868]EPE34175.1 Putative Zn(II)2Cys6 transcription factor (Eurofung) [Glarea lozoyensis ATCC 20868]
MSEDQTLKKAREGTKSCTECRRRKVRCIRVPENAQACRRCEERASECVAQRYSAQPVHSHKLSSRDRIAKLEMKVASLSKTICDIEMKLGNVPVRVSEEIPTLAESSPETYESDGESTLSDVLALEPPSHIHSLFQNDWLNVDTNRQDDQLNDHQTRPTAILLNKARHALQKAIPLKYEVSQITGSGSIWLDFFHNLFPQPFALKSAQEILDCYEEMCKPDIDAISLATWLMTIAITAHQVPPRCGNQSASPDRFQSYSKFSQKVSEIVESTLISHDSVVSTVNGLGMAINFVRLQMSRGNLQKAWLRLRHFISIAELMGLPNACQAVQSSQCDGPDFDTQHQMAQLWELFCSIDGLSGIVLNMPPCINPCQRPKPPPLTVDGVVQPRAYISRLIAITTKIHYRQDLTVTRASAAELYASALDRDRELKVLVSQTPKSWWVGASKNVVPDHIVQFFHYCISMRVHLPFGTREDPDKEYAYSCLTCRDDCESVIQLYIFLRRELPGGIFIAQRLDLQAFIATVILLLVTHVSPSTNLQHSPINQDNIDSQVTQVIELMDARSKNTMGFQFARRCIRSIRSLKELLQDNDKSRVKELTLKVPLLGKVYVRRNTSSLPTQDTQTQPPLATSMDPNVGSQDDQLLTSQEDGFAPFNADDPVASDFQWQAMEELPWELLTRQIEDQYGGLFQDAFMTDGAG